LKMEKQGKDILRMFVQKESEGGNVWLQNKRRAETLDGGFCLADRAVSGIPFKMLIEGNNNKTEKEKNG
jgi:hypothetical protein